jgi:hypothetical protein
LERRPVLPLDVGAGGTARDGDVVVAGVVPVLLRKAGEAESGASAEQSEPIVPADRETA